MFSLMNCKVTQVACISLLYCHMSISCFCTGVCNSIAHPVTKEILFHTINRCRWQPHNKQPHPPGQTDRLLMPPPQKKLKQWNRRRRVLENVAMVIRKLWLPSDLCCHSLLCSLIWFGFFHPWVPQMLYAHMKYNIFTQPFIVWIK